METFDFNKDTEILIYGYCKVGQDLHHRLARQGYRLICLKIIELRKDIA